MSEYSKDELKDIYVNGTDGNKKTPKSEGFHMPAEWTEHEGTIMIWPYREDNWGRKQDENGEIKVLGQIAFAEVARKIADFEPVYMFVNDEKEKENAEKMINHPNVKVEIAPSNDAWARDMAGIFVIDGNNRKILDFGFNAWGYTEDKILKQLYNDVEKDREFPIKSNEILSNAKKEDFYFLHDFILEGGSIAVDGQGNIMVTEECLLNPGRRLADFYELEDNKSRKKILEAFDNLSKEEKKEVINYVLCEYLGGEHVVWLERGIVNDETSGHVDNICCFIEPGVVALAWPPEPDKETGKDSEWLEDWQEQLEICEENERRLKAEGYKVYRIPLPKKPVRITEEEAKRVVDVDGTLPRNEEDRLAASYINFYRFNGGILIPSFGEESDKVALEVFKEMYKNTDVKIIQLSEKSTREILLGGGNIHCITQQIPKIPITYATKNALESGITHYETVVVKKPEEKITEKGAEKIDVK